MWVVRVRVRVGVTVAVRASAGERGEGEGRGPERMPARVAPHHSHTRAQLEADRHRRCLPNSQPGNVLLPRPTQRSGTVAVAARRSAESSEMVPVRATLRRSRPFALRERQPFPLGVLPTRRPLTAHLAVLGCRARKLAGDKRHPLHAGRGLGGACDGPISPTPQASQPRRATSARRVVMVCFPGRKEGRKKKKKEGFMDTKFPVRA